MRRSTFCLKYIIMVLIPDSPSKISGVVLWSFQSPKNRTHWRFLRIIAIYHLSRNHIVITRISIYTFGPVRYDAPITLSGTPFIWSFLSVFLNTNKSTSIFTLCPQTVTWPCPYLTSLINLHPTGLLPIHKTQCRYMSAFISKLVSSTLYIISSWIILHLNWLIYATHQSWSTLRHCSITEFESRPYSWWTKITFTRCTVDIIIYYLLLS